ncbi:hypothetical protein QY625_003696 [Salmonella enterica]|nr:hypothetical protein [Salmonella enterica]
MMIHKQIPYTLKRLMNRKPVAVKVIRNKRFRKYCASLLIPRHCFFGWLRSRQSGQQIHLIFRTLPVINLITDITLQKINIISGESVSIMTIKTKNQPTFSGADSTENDLNHASVIFTPLRQTYCDGPLSVNPLISVTDEVLDADILY